jgi:hypothetical protein
MGTKASQKCVYCGSALGPGGQRHLTDWGTLCAYCFGHVWSPCAPPKQQSKMKEAGGKLGKG